MKTAIGSKEAKRQERPLELAKILADETVHYIKIKNVYWNIEGADFYDKDKFL